MGENQKKFFIIIDSNSIIHRAFHALPPLTTKKGELVNAVYGFLLVFFKAIREFQPDFVAACFDYPAPTFRHKKFKEYKATRPPTPKDLVSQIPKVKEILSVFNISIFEKEGFEADDLIGTICKKFPKKQFFPTVETIILSGDLDTLQLVDSKTKVYNLGRGVTKAILYDENLVEKRYQGLKPFQLVDFKALKGDPSDNIPGITGIGAKTAREIIKEFGDLETFYRNLEEKTEKIKKLNPKLREILLQKKEQVFLSKILVEIKKDILIDFDLKECQWGKYNEGKVIKILEKFEFHSLINRLKELKLDKRRKEELKLL